jgi:hypothetical protein
MTNKQNKKKNHLPFLHANPVAQLSNSRQTTEDI